MRGYELIESPVPDSISQYLLNKGYKFLGSGVDQLAFSEPSTGQVLKIFRAESSGYPGNSNFTSPGHEMFAEWAALCNKNTNNPFLPKYSGWETFEWEDETYLQIRMELLQKLPDDISDALESMARSIQHCSSPQRYNQVKSRLLDVIGDSDTDEQEGLNQLVLLLGKAKLTLLMDTIFKLAVIADESGWYFDLHGDNFMHRNDGTPIITDPWII